MKGITDVDYKHAKIVCKGFEIKNLGDYHGLHVQSNTLLLANVFKNLCLEKCVLKYMSLILFIFSLNQD